MTVGPVPVRTLVAVAAALALVATPAPAPIGAAPGMGGGMQERVGPDRRPVREAQAPMPGMGGTPMEHPTGSPPFYRERTFLVLVGVGLAGAGLVAYRVGRARRRRRPGPASFVSEAVLVVDLVDSTTLATHYGDGLAMRARTILRERALAAVEGQGLAFAESTGDGYLLTFPSVVGAVKTATALLTDLRDRPPDLSPGPPLAVRAGISYGEILLDARGGRHGAAMNKAFRLEGLSCESFAPVGQKGRPPEVPDRNRIFIDEEAAKELGDAGAPQRLVGFCSLKGFSGLHRVYEVLWEPRG